MEFKRKHIIASGLLVAACSVFSLGAQAAAIITNGTVKMGINDQGNLNVAGGAPSIVDGTTVVGLRLVTAAGEYESTSHGCTCEGWGAGVAGSGISGSANDDVGPFYDVTQVSFVSTAMTATSVVDIDGALRVTHHYAPSADTPFLYEVAVTIENISGTILGDTTAGSTDLRYRRTMDWDVEPTTFDEYSTIGGWPAANLIGSSDDGFASSDPLSGALADIGGCAVNGNFTDCGAADHGAAFDFGFEGLGIGESKMFSIFYGAAPTEAQADVARALAGVEVYSYGQCNPAVDSVCSLTAGTPVTHIFGFAGVGGTPPPPIPVPATLALLGLGLMGMARSRRRKA